MLLRPIRPTRATVCAALAVALAAPGAAPTAAQEPARPVEIGLVIPADGPLVKVGQSVLEGAEEAVRSANAEGGFHGRPFRLRVVWEDGLWGQGLSRVVSLAYDDPVRAIIGGLDGRGAHLIEQIITKARVPYITPWASDFTLSRAMVPWFFQAVPDDVQQAEAMVRDALVRGRTELWVAADTAYDSRQLASALRLAAADRDVRVRRLPTGALLRVLQRGRTPGIAGSGSAVVITGAGGAALLLQRLGRMPAPPPVYAPLRLAGTDLSALAGSYPGPVLVPVPEPGTADAPPGARLTAGLPAALGHDAVRAVVEAVRAAGLDHWAIRDTLTARTVYGTTGALSFEDSGRRRGELRLRPVAGPGRAPDS